MANADANFYMLFNQSYFQQTGKGFETPEWQEKLISRIPAVWESLKEPAWTVDLHGGIGKLSQVGQLTALFRDAKTVGWWRLLVGSVY